MNKTQLQKKELQDELYKLEHNYSKLSNEYNALEKEKDSNLMTCLLGGLGFGIPFIFYGLQENNSILLILGGGIMSLCIVFGSSAYANNKKVEGKQNKINIDMHNIGKNIEDIKSKIENLKTIKIVLKKFIKQKYYDDNIYNITIERTIDNCFYTLVNFFEGQERAVMLRNKEYIYNYIDSCDKFEDVIYGLDSIEYNKIDEYERIEAEENIIKDIIYIYMSCVKELFQIFLDEKSCYEDFIKNGKLTHTGVTASRILKKLELLEAEYTT